MVGPALHGQQQDGRFHDQQQRAPGPSPGATLPARETRRRPERPERGQSLPQSEERAAPIVEAAGRPRQEEEPREQAVGTGQRAEVVHEAVQATGEEGAVHMTERADVAAAERTGHEVRGQVVERAEVRGATTNAPRHPGVDTVGWNDANLC